VECDALYYGISLRLFLFSFSILYFGLNKLAKNIQRSVKSWRGNYYLSITMLSDPREDREKWDKGPLHEPIVNYCLHFSRVQLHKLWQPELVLFRGNFILSYNSSAECNGIVHDLSLQTPTFCLNIFIISFLLSVGLVLLSWHRFSIQLILVLTLSVASVWLFEFDCRHTIGLNLDDNFSISGSLFRPRYPQIMLIQPAYACIQ
jgi:hypothetical protein